MKKLNKDNKGFSLVELLVVSAIMVVLVGVIAPTLLNNIEKSREAKDVQTLDAIAGAIQSAVTDETAATDMSKLEDKVYSVTKLYDETNYSGLAKKMKEYLAQPSIATSFSGTKVDKTTMDIYFLYTGGRISVFVAETAKITEGTTTAVPADATAGLLIGKRETKYSVTR